MRQWLTSLCCESYMVLLHKLDDLWMGSFAEVSRCIYFRQREGSGTWMVALAHFQDSGVLV